MATVYYFADTSLHKLHHLIFTMQITYQARMMNMQLRKQPDMYL
jgi:hypothetical protein